jgi:hypothetical protein
VTLYRVFDQQQGPYHLVDLEVAARQGRRPHLLLEAFVQRQAYLASVVASQALEVPVVEQKPSQLQILVIVPFADLG